MYESYFKFNGRPFTSTPYPKHYFPGESIRDALEQTRLCIDRSSGPVVIVSSTGMGKTLLLQMLAETYAADFNVVNLGCARLGQRADLLQSILFELDQPYREMQEGELRLSLMDYLRPSEQCPHGVLLLIDDAHSLPFDLLDELRLLTNYIRDGEPRVRLVLAGNQRLEENLLNNKLESLNQRIAGHFYLSGLSQQETGQYVCEHLNRVGSAGVFDDRALREIHRITEGCPRKINQLCEHSLVLAAGKQRPQIDSPFVEFAWNDLQNIPATDPDQYTAQESSCESEEQWTVIEFGALEEDEPKNDPETSVWEIAPADSNEPDDNELDRVLFEGVEPVFLSEAFPFSSTGAPLTISNSSAVIFNEDDILGATVTDFQTCLGPAAQGSQETMAWKARAWVDGSGFANVEMLAVDTCEMYPGASIERNDQDNSISSSPTIGNPFEEPFDLEEWVDDRFVPEFAEQNLTSLDVSREDLQHLRPLADGEWETFPRETEFDKPLAVAATAPVDHAESNQSEQDSNNDTAIGSAKDSIETAHPQSVENLQDSVHQFLAELEDSVENDCAQQTPPAADTVADADAEPGDQDEIQFVIDQAFIERRADAVLQSLSQLGEQIEQAIDVHLPNQMESDATSEPSTADLQEPSSALDPQLCDIQNELNAFPPASDEGANPEATANTNENVMGIEHPIGNEQTQGVVDSSGESADDRDMIIVSQVNRLPNRTTEESAIADPLQTGEPSKGRAKRMDYKRLFDQLREVSENP